MSGMTCGKCKEFVSVKTYKTAQGCPSCNNDFGWEQVRWGLLVPLLGLALTGITECMAAKVDKAEPMYQHRYQVYALLIGGGICFYISQMLIYLTLRALGVGRPTRNSVAFWGSWALTIWLGNMSMEALHQ
jgi:hypothetical protein